MHIWYDLPYFATDDAIDSVLDRWLEELHTTSNLAVRTSKFFTQCKKEEAKLKMSQLAEKRKKEAATTTIGSPLDKSTRAIDPFITVWNGVHQPHYQHFGSCRDVM